MVWISPHQTYKTVSIHRNMADLSHTACVAVAGPWLLLWWPEKMCWGWGRTSQWKFTETKPSPNSTDKWLGVGTEKDRLTCIQGNRQAERQTEGEREQISFQETLCKRALLRETTKVSTSGTFTSLKPCTLTHLHQEWFSDTLQTWCDNWQRKFLSF